MKKKSSFLHKVYWARLIGRIFIFMFAIYLFLTRKEIFNIVNGYNFFKSFSILHLLWGLWIFDMLCQLIPISKQLSIGSMKHFKSHFKPIKDKVLDKEAVKEYIKQTTKSAYKVFFLYLAMVLAIGYLYNKGIIDYAIVFLIVVFFYVCDLICVLIWCPFRLMMGNRCCTTCRIFNWDHIMMFSPFVFVKGFYPLSLFFMSLVVFIMWELTTFMHPERFWDETNSALKCSNCTDKICTQYCGKMKKVAK